jgi:hypothetical protein
MQETTSETRTLYAAQLVNDNHNNWGGSAPVEDIAAAHYAVIVEREDESWVLAAANVQEVAEIIADTYTATEGYDEWVCAIHDMETCAEVKSYRGRVIVEINIDGAIASAQRFGA